MATKVLVAKQHKFDANGSITEKLIHRFQYAPGEIDQMRAQTKIEKCLRCDRTIVGRNIVELGYFDPWQPLGDEPEYTDYYCRKCDDQYGPSYDGIQWCERCERDITTNSGYRSHFVRDPELFFHGTMCCVGCAQRFAKKYGHTLEQINSGQVPCDFYSYHELEDAGFEEGETFYGSELARTKGREWRKYCQKLHEDGYIMLTDQGATGLGNGYPDSVTVWFKKSEVEVEVA